MNLKKEKSFKYTTHSHRNRVLFYQKACNRLGYLFYMLWLSFKNHIWNIAIRTIGMKERIRRQTKNKKQNKPAEC